MHIMFIGMHRKNKQLAGWMFLTPEAIPRPVFIATSDPDVFLGSVRQLLADLGGDGDLSSVTILKP